MIPPAGISYSAFKDAWRVAVQARPGGDAALRRTYFYKKYNLERSERVEAAFTPSPALREVMASITAPQTWMVLTEDWCVDSAYSLPVIARAASLSPLVRLSVLPRDRHPDVMDAYLTNGSRSIPKLVAFDAGGEVLFEWGPRPEALATYRQQMVSQGVDNLQVSARVAAWYDEGGWQQVEAELIACIAKARASV